MKEWRTTVGDYLQELHGGWKAWLSVAAVFVLLICSVMALNALRVHCRETYRKSYDRAIALMEEGRYSEAAEEYGSMLTMLERMDHSIFRGVIFTGNRFPVFVEELNEVVNAMLREGEYRRAYEMVSDELKFADRVLRQRVYLAYANERYAAGDYREATEAYLLLKEITGTSGNLRSAAELYAEELRAAGDEAGAEAWLEYVEERRCGAE